MKYAILGATGAVGKELAALLANRQEKFRVVGRHQAELTKAFAKYEPHVDYCVADLETEAGAQKAVKGIETVFYVVGVPYHRFELHPKLSALCTKAATEAHVKNFIHLGTLYSYGLMQGPRITETHPRAPHTYKGRMRKEQEDIVMNAHNPNGMKVTILRAPDFYGGDSPLSLMHRIFQGAINNARADAIGPIDLPHEFVYVPDLARTLLQLSEKPEAYGKTWNLAGPGQISVQEFANQIYAKQNQKPKLRVAGKLMLRILGLFNPFMKEFVEMHYLMAKPLFVDDRALKKLIPEMTKTSYADGLTKTLEFMSKNKVAPSRDNQL